MYVSLRLITLSRESCLIWRNNIFLPVCLQFADSSKGLGCSECPEGWKLERWLLLNPKEHEVHGTLLNSDRGFRRAQSWAMAQGRVTVNVSERHYSLLKDKIVTEKSAGPAGWIWTILPASRKTQTLNCPGNILNISC